jgi:hypothetical protein
MAFALSIQESYFERGRIGILLQSSSSSRRLAWPADWRISVFSFLSARSHSLLLLPSPVLLDIFSFFFRKLLNVPRFFPRNVGASKLPW